MKGKSFVYFSGFTSDFEGKLFNIPLKVGTYQKFFGELTSRGYDVYYVNGIHNIITPGVYKTYAQFIGGEFVLGERIIKPEVVFDASAGTSHPTFHQSNVINSLEFKIFCANKYLSYMHFQDHFPKTFLYRQKELIPFYLENLGSESVILKPEDGLKGEGIFKISRNDKDQALKILSGNEGHYLVQEIIDTDIEVAGLVNGLHDIRVVVVGGEVVWSHIRKPVEGDFRSNVALGGDLQDLDFSTVPSEVSAFVDEVIGRIEKLFGDAVYSIDFGITKVGPKIFEFNSRMGFPRETAKDRDRFINSLVSRIERSL